MYRSLFFLFILLPLQALIAQPAIEWAKCYGGTSFDGARSIVATSDGGYILVGETFSTDGDVSGLHVNTDPNSGNADYWVVKIDNLGKIQWQKCLGSYGDDQGELIIQTKDGGYAIAGYTYPDSANDGDIHGAHFFEGIWFVKIDSMGKTQWQRALGGYETKASAIVQATDGGFVISGYTTSKNGDIVGLHYTDSTQESDCWIVKLDTIGNIQWQQTLGGYESDEANSIINTFDGGYIVAASTNSNDGDVTDSHGSEDAWIIKLNDSGKVQWKKTYGGSASDNALKIFQQFDSGCIFFGYTSSMDGDVKSNPDSGGYWMVKINKHGEIQSEKVLGNSKKFPYYSIINVSDGGYVFAGTVSQRKSDFSIIKLNEMGDLVWQKTMGGSGVDYGYSDAESKDGGYIMAGETSSIDGDVTGIHDSVRQLADAWVVKLFSDKNNVANHRDLEQQNISIFPNPNNGIGKIKYTLNKSSQVQIEIYDAIGRLTQILANDFENLGDHEYNFDVSTFSSGQYFIHLESEGISIVKGFEIVK